MTTTRSSSKLQFTRDTLKERALAVIDQRIADAQLRVDSCDDPVSLETRVEEWRARQEARISELFSKLGGSELDDYTLSRWKVEPIPVSDPYQKDRLTRSLESLKLTREQIIAKADSIVADSEGNIRLTSRQLEEFFGL